MDAIRTDPEWLSPAALGEMFGLPTATIYSWRHRGIGPRAHRLGRHLRYRLADVEAWLAEQADPPSSTPTSSRARR
jgi:predicted DNA-binding transcriptional regulator AlpA